APPPPAAPAPLAVGDVAEVATAPTSTTSLSRTDGRPSIGVAVTRTPDGNTVAISEEVGELVPALQEAVREQTGGQAQVTVVFDQAPFIESSVEDLTVEGLLGLAFAVLVILVFLLSVRSTLVTAVSIPLSLLFALIGLLTAGYTLNLLTLSALTISIGRVVDDSIVVVENITRHLRLGEDKRTAIVGGVREVAAAVTASTVTTTAVFLPLAVVGGTAGELFRPFAVTVALALGASLLVSLTIVPVLSWWFLRAPDDHAGARPARVADAPDRLQRAYLPVLRASLRRPLLTALAAVVVLGGTVGLATRLETDFLGSAGQNTLTVAQQLPAGTSLEVTDEAARRVEEVIADQPEVVTQQVTVGSGDPAQALFGGGSGGSASASFAVTLELGDDAEAVRDRLRAALEDLDDVGEVTVSLGQGGPGSEGVEVVVQAPDEEVLREATEQVRGTVEDAPGAQDVSDDLAAELPALAVVVDREAAAAVGLSEAAVGQAVSARTQGSRIGRLETTDGPQDVVLRVGAPPADVVALRSLPLAAPLAPGQVVPLSAVAEVQEVEQPTTITRRDGRRSATVTAAVSTEDSGGLGALSADLGERLDALDLPAGATATLGGVSADQQETFGQLGLALLAAIAIVYTVMVGTFRSLLQPVVLLASIPFAATGALALLLATGTPLGVAALIGALMLVGVVVTNAIVLIDLVNQHRRDAEHPLPLAEAVVEGARHRLRPILMTALATILALTPMALGITGGSAFISQPLALVVIGGLVSSTALTLVIVPVLYLVTERRVERGAARRAARRTSRSQRRQDHRRPPEQRRGGDG
ncbi:MAG: RND multidrug efflux transporter; Acriflavin resistance protein, partial [uncultured Quadrisphaera sp.]